jgi:hypothetical protein
LICCADSFELPTKPNPVEKPKRTVSMRSLKVHVDNEDYQSEVGGGTSGNVPEAKMQDRVEDEKGI